VLKLSKRTENLLNAFFPESLRGEAKDLIETMCGDNLPFCENSRSEEIERIRFSAIRISEGKLDKLCDAIELAQTDWRDLLMAAGFGQDPEEHNKWYKDRFGESLWWKI
jgi:hypothetical protein